MRKNTKLSLLDIVKTIYDAHEDIKKLLKNGYVDTAASLIGDCQDAVLSIGNTIIESEDKECVTIGFIQNYCRDIFDIYNSINDECEYDINELVKLLNKDLTDIKKSIEKDIIVKLEVVFMPYKASMWDSLESVWKAADEDPDCDAYVVPIPYYDRNPDHSFGTLHYEGTQFPDCVPVTHYMSYDESKRKPDVIYIHNPYDDCNYVTSVHPRFYSHRLKKFTEKLIYIPYFSNGGVQSESFKYLPSYMNVDYIITQSDSMCKFYHNNKIIQSKLLPLGSPKFDHIIKTDIKKSDAICFFGLNGYKKIFFYNSSISSLLQYSNKILGKINLILDIFQNDNESGLIWRPHPLTEATIKSMRPDMYESYIQLINKAESIKNVVVDKSPGADMAIIASDAYIGEATSSILHLFGVTGKPIFLTNQSISINTNSEKCNFKLFDFVEVNGYIWACAGDRNVLLKFDMNYNIIKTYIIPDNIYICHRRFNSIAFSNEKIFFTPYNTKELLVFNIKEEKFFNIPINIRNDMEYSKLYTKSFVYKESIFMVPCTADSIIQINTISDKITYHENIFKCINNLNPEDGIYSFNGSVIDGNTLYIALASVDIVLAFNLDTFKVEVHNVFNNKEGFWCIQGQNDRFILGSNNGGNLIYWSPKKEITKKLHVPEKLNGKCHYFYNMTIYNNIVFVFPKDSNMLLKVNLETGDVSECYRKLTDIVNQRKNEYYNWNSNTLMCKTLNNGDILCQFAYEYGLEVLGTDDSVTHFTFSLPDFDDMLLSNDLFSEKYGIPYAVQETMVFNVSDFIKFVKSDKFDSEKQIEAYTAIASNIDGTAGQKIHETIIKGK